METCNIAINNISNSKAIDASTHLFVASLSGNFNLFPRSWIAEERPLIITRNEFANAQLQTKPKDYKLPNKTTWKLDETSLNNQRTLQ